MPLDISIFRIIRYIFFVSGETKISCSNLIIKILRRRFIYGLVKKARKFEKFDFKYRKAEFGAFTIIQEKKSHSEVLTA